MEFLQSQTCQNLARSFAGESQARSRYTIYAGQARKEGQEYLARIFEQTAENEAAHAKEFLEMLKKLAGKPAANIRFDAGYPYELGATAENLQFAAAGEQQEHGEILPGLCTDCPEEGYADAAALWENIAVIEGLAPWGFSPTPAAAEVGQPVPQGAAGGLAVPQLRLYHRGGGTLEGLPGVPQGDRLGPGVCGRPAEKAVALHKTAAGTGPLAGTGCFACPSVQSSAQHRANRSPFCAVNRYHVPVKKPAAIPAASNRTQCRRKN